MRREISKPIRWKPLRKPNKLAGLPEFFQHPPSPQLAEQGLKDNSPWISLERSHGLAIRKEQTKEGMNESLAEAVTEEAKTETMCEILPILKVVEASAEGQAMDT